GQTGQVPVGVASGVGVVPTAGVEGVALERLDAGDAGQLGPVQRSARHADVAGAHLVAAVRRDEPTVVGIVPPHRRDLGLEAGVAVEIEVTTDRPAVFEDLGGL